MREKYLILDFGKVLAYPTTGDWFITPLFLKLIDMNKICKNKLLIAMENYDHIIARKLISLEEEYEMFFEFYTSVFKEINYEIDKKTLSQIAYNITYSDEKYIFYNNIKDELELVSKKYRLLLLSDNWPCMFRVMKNANIDKYFEKMYVSSIYGVEKKDKVFFDYPINEFGIKKGEALFIDDNELLLDIAYEKGFNVRLMDREKEIISSKYKIINNLLDL